MHPLLLCIPGLSEKQEKGFDEVIAAGYRTFCVSLKPSKKFFLYRTFGSLSTIRLRTLRFAPQVKLFFIRISTFLKDPKANRTFYANCPENTPNWNYRKCLEYHKCRCLNL